VFLRFGIPYQIVGGVKFYQRKEIKDILAYLRLIQNPNDTVSLIRIINNPPRKIGPATLEKINNFAAKNHVSFFDAMLLIEEIKDIPEAKRETITKFVKLIKGLGGRAEDNTVSSLIKYIVNDSGYKKMLDDNTVENEARLENIQELVSVAHKYDKLDPGTSLDVFLEEVSLIADIDNLKDSANSVVMMTVHSAKGLEFPYVFLAGLEEGIFPHNRSMTDRLELEEERRLMYVAITRAMEGVYLLHAQSRMLYGEERSNAPSQFLADIDENLIEANFGAKSARVHIPLSEIGTAPVPIEAEIGVLPDLGVGDKVFHSTFGNGIVVNVTGGVVTVAFEDSKVGVKKLALSIAPLKKV
jgi:DNA helicase-2/ATP-dependent DNA helicase PcrA